MNKFFGTLLVVLLAIILTGCKNSVTNLDGKEKTKFGINETAVYKNIDYTITKAEYTDGSKEGFGQLENENNIFYALTFQVKNNSKKSYYSSYSCILKTKEITSEQITTHSTGTNQFKALYAGKSYTTTLFWEISKEDVAQSYKCYINGIEFTFDLTK